MGGTIAAGAMRAGTPAAGDDLRAAPGDCRASHARVGETPRRGTVCRCAGFARHCRLLREPGSRAAAARVRASPQRCDESQVRLAPLRAIWRHRGDRAVELSSRHSAGADDSRRGGGQCRSDQTFGANALVRRAGRRAFLPGRFSSWASAGDSGQRRAGRSADPSRAR